MILSRLTLTASALRDGGVRSKLRHGAYGHHQLLMEAYGNHQDGRLLFRQEEEQADGALRFLTLTPTEPDGPGLAHFETEHKPFTPRLDPGDRLAFSIRVNPVAARREDGAHRGKRRDVVYEALRQCRANGEASEAFRPHLAQREGSAWLLPRLERAGLTTDADVLRCDGYRRHQLNRKGIVISTLDCTGSAVVTDPTALCNALATGIGPAKGFGCGMLLIRRA